MHTDVMIFDLLLAVRDGDLDRPIPAAGRLLREAEHRGWITRGIRRVQITDAGLTMIRGL